MLDRAHWDTIVDDNKKGGIVQYWLTQMDSSYLRKNYPKGVCHALTFDWIRSKRGYSSDVKTFASQFNANNKVKDADIPHIYVEKQTAYSNSLALAQARLNALNSLTLASTKVLSDAINRRDADPTDAHKADVQKVGKIADQDLQNYQSYATFVQGGSDCLGKWNFDTLQDALAFVEKNSNSIWMLIMTKTTDGETALGHVFGFVPTPGGMWDFFDANFAMVWFSGFDELRTFVTKHLWPYFYLERGVPKYDLFALYKFNLGLKGGDDDSKEKKQQPAQADLQEMTPAELQKEIEDLAKFAKVKRKSLCVIL